MNEQLSYSRDGESGKLLLRISTKPISVQWGGTSGESRSWGSIHHRTSHFGASGVSYLRCSSVFLQVVSLFSMGISIIYLPFVILYLFLELFEYPEPIRLLQTKGWVDCRRCLLGLIISIESLEAYRPANAIWRYIMPQPLP